MVGKAIAFDYDWSVAVNNTIGAYGTGAGIILYGHGGCDIDQTDRVLLAHMLAALSGRLGRRSHDLH